MATDFLCNFGGFQRLDRRFWEIFQIIDFKNNGELQSMFGLYGDYPHVVSADFIESEGGFLRLIFMHFFMDFSDNLRFLGLQILNPENINGFVEDIGDCPLEALATDFLCNFGTGIWLIDGRFQELFQIIDFKNNGELQSMFGLYGDYPHVVSADFIESEGGFLRLIFMHFFGGLWR